MDGYNGNRTQPALVRAPDGHGGSGGQLAGDAFVPIDIIAIGNISGIFAALYFHYAHDQRPANRHAWKSQDLRF
ncbi:hypothetical protein FKV24_017290 [Lysobacter maris]|uniref:Uncharacterized protein n=1 Tax=Marilutibacter maris TaxID=1605891 RepID=A0A507ZUE6_9GAMM|nr:hypothetical protein [Lysobacter maris]KAB8164901.1 hypothetical protein FKV24_017290 [Lysobacter maris]